MSNSFTLLENSANNDPVEIASKAKDTKQEKPKFVEEKKPVQQNRKPKATSAPAEAVEEGFQGTRAKGRGGRPQHHGHQAPKKGRAFDRHVSGTGAKKGDTKKGGSGKANWGKPTEAKEEKPEVEQQSEAAGEQATEEKKEETTTTVEATPVDTSLTLEEYLKSKKSTSVSLKKEAGEQIVTGKNVKLVETAFERSSEELFQKEKKKVDKEEKGDKKTEKKPKTIAVSDFLDTASLEKIKERRDKEYLEGPKTQFKPRTGGKPAGRGGNQRKGGNNKTANKPATQGQKKPRPVINNEKDFPSLSQN